MSEKLVFVSIWEDGTIHLMDGQLIGKLVDSVFYNELPVYEEKEPLTPIPFFALQAENENLRYENQRLSIINHYHRGETI
jgi:hypothetical protein